MAEKKHTPLQSNDHTPIEEVSFSGLVYKNNKGENAVEFLIEGVHCAACIQKIETLFSHDPDIKKARLNFSQRKLSLTWHGEIKRVDEFVHRIKKSGYGVQAFARDVFEQSHKKESRFLLFSLGVAGFAAGNVMLLSVGLWITTAESMGQNMRELLHWISALIAVPAICVAGRPFFYSAYNALKHGRTNMDVPISVALIITSCVSLYEMAAGGEHVYFDSCIMLLFLLLIGRYLDFMAKRAADRSAIDLMETVDNVSMLVNEDGSVTQIVTKDINVGMVLRILSGQTLPTDSILITKRASLDTKLLTGESVPKTYHALQNVHAGMVNVGGPIDIRVEKTPQNSILKDIMELVEQAKQSKSFFMRLADRISSLYTPIIHVLALAVFFVWLFVFGLIWQEAMMIAVTVLIITCPCALALAVTIVNMLASNKLLKDHVIIRSSDALEKLGTIDTVVFDKTGTLTKGFSRLTGGYDVDSLKLAASLASYSQHPYSKAIVNAYGGEALFQLDEVEEQAGLGLIGYYKGKEVRLGSYEWVHGSKPVSDIDHTSTVYLKSEQSSKPIAFTFKDGLKDDAFETIKTFKNAGLDVHLLSGDKSRVLEGLAQELEIETYLSEKDPKEKFEYIQTLQRKGHAVLMVGDGLNDVAAMALADVSMAPSSAFNMAGKQADLIVIGERLMPMYEAYKQSLKAKSLIKQNIALALLYNIVAIPFAMMGMVTPLIAALSMSASSLIVILNSFRIKKWIF